MWPIGYCRQPGAAHSVSPRQHAICAHSQRAHTRRNFVATDLEGFVSSDGRDDKIAEVRRRIDAEGITYIYYQFISVTGRIMGKGVPAPHWESMAQKGFQLVYGSTANLFTDRHGEYIGYGPEAWELVRLPAVERVCLMPWGPKTGRVVSTWCR